jgi:hypothetical protein
MSDARRAHCRHCRNHRDICGPISWSGYCSPCGKFLFIENLDSLRTKTGAPYDRWNYARLVSCVGPRVAYALKQSGVLEHDLATPTP